MTGKILLPVLALAWTVLACSLQINTTNPPPITVTDTPIPPVTITDTPIPPPPSGLTLDMLHNGRYNLEGCSGAVQTFQLINGPYVSGADPTTADYVAIYMGDQVPFSDLNDDGVDDAVVVLGVNCGGTGVFTYLAAVLNNSGAPVFAASAFLNDRPMINSLSIANDEILSDIILHNADDPMCCPTLQTRQG